MPNGIRSERDGGRGVDQLKLRCGLLLKHPISTVSSLEKKIKKINNNRVWTAVLKFRNPWVANRCRRMVNHSLDSNDVGCVAPELRSPVTLNLFSPKAAIIALPYYCTHSFFSHGFCQGSGRRRPASPPPRGLFVVRAALVVILVRRVRWAAR